MVSKYEAPAHWYLTDVNLSSFPLPVYIFNRHSQDGESVPGCHEMLSQFLWAEVMLRASETRSVGLQDEHGKNETSIGYISLLHGLHAHFLVLFHIFKRTCNLRKKGVILSVQFQLLVWPSRALLSAVILSIPFVWVLVLELDVAQSTKSNWNSWRQRLGIGTQFQFPYICLLLTFVSHYIWEIRVIWTVVRYGQGT